MTKLGNLRIGINRELYFEYHELLKPDQNDVDKYREYSNKYFDDLKEYEASKREAEVSNIIEQLIPYLNEKKVYKYYDVMFDRNNFEQININQPCEARIENKIAIITKIL